MSYPSLRILQRSTGSIWTARKFDERLTMHAGWPRREKTREAREMTAKPGERHETPAERDAEVFLVFSMRWPRGKLTKTVVERGG